MADRVTPDGMPDLTSIASAFTYTHPPEPTWKVDQFGFVDYGPNRAKFGCHHTTTSGRACGGCYARLGIAMDQIDLLLQEGKVAEARTLIGKISAVRKAEKKG